MNHPPMRVVGVDTDGCLVCEDRGEVYNCGETLEEFGAHNLSPAELAAVNPLP